jgi:hypothetical protein
MLWSQVHIANVIMITAKYCDKLTPVQQYIVVLRSIEHLERIERMDREKTLKVALPAHEIALDAAVVMVSNLGS